MANKQALRELQTRLAERLQAARTQARGQSWLAVECGGHGFLLPLREAGEIFALAPIQPVPYSRDWFLGVANLRGGLFGVVQLSTFATGAAAAPVLNEATRAQSRLVALNEMLEVNCALLIDRLVGLRGVDAFVASEAPQEASPPWLGHSYTDAAGGRWQEINLQALSQQPQFLSIGA